MPIRSACAARCARRCLVVAAISVMAVTLARQALARPEQSATAVVQGVVRDESDAERPGATIVLTDLDTGTTRRGPSSSDGSFRFVALAPGRYRLTAELSGFAPVQRNLDLSLDQVLDLPIRLSVAHQSLAVEVNATDPPLIEPSKTALGRTITEREINELPIPIGLFRDFTTLATLAPGVISDVIGGSPIATAGQSGNDNTFLLDGLSVDSAIAGNQTATLPPDAIREFRVVSNNFGVEFGQASGAVVNVVTQSGTNSSRARGYYLQQDGAWDATSATAKAAGVMDPDLRQETFGAYWGGPLVRQRAFLFGSAEQVLRRTVYAISSPAAPVFRPADPVVWPTDIHAPKAFVRADLNASSANALTLRYSHTSNVNSDSSRESQSAFERGRTSETDIDNAAVLDTHVIGSSVVNEARAQWTRSLNDIRVDGFCPDCAALNYPDIKLGKPANAPQRVIGERSEVADVLTWLAGAQKHQSITAGIDANLIETFGENPLNTTGTYTFPKSAGPFNALDSGSYPSRFTQNRGDAHFNVHATIVSTFGQDAWQPREGLSVTGGVRWDHTDWSGLPSHRDDVAPRAGVAFDPWKTGITIFRAAIGRYYDEMLMPIARDGVVGFVQVTINQPGYQGDLRSFDPYGPNPRRAGPAQASFSANRLAPIATPYTDQASVGLQRQVGSDWGLSIDLVRALGYRLLVEGDLNRIDPVTHAKSDPTIDQILVTETTGRSWYTGLQVGLRKRLSHGYGVSAAYTWSTSENNSDGRSVLPVDPDDLMVDRGPSPNDARHRVTATGTVDLPLACRLATVVTARSSLPYNVTTGLDGNNDGQNNDRPAGVSRDSARGSPAFQADVRVSKLWTFGKPRLEVLLETFNVTNRANWSGYNGVRTAASFGQPTAAGLPRQLQLGLRFDF